ncbi:MAG: hypothetical protein JWM41_2963 [Gemmatimonadetes bacterium]|nr:hypothetical protein [Gemmatimonadota bacterium]
MISLRSVTTFTAALVVALSLSGCADTATNPLTSSGLRPSGASFSSSKTVTGAIDSRVLLNKAGDASLEVHTGTFDDATNVAAANGTLSSLTYTVKNGSTMVTTHTVKFNKTASSYFVHLNLCQSSNDDDDDDDGSSSASACSQHWLPAYKLTVSANLKGLGSDGKSSGTASGDAIVMYLPDIDLTQQALSIVGGGGLTPATSVTPAVPTTFSVPFPNNKPIVNGPLGSGTVPNGVGVQTTCLVTVDGLPQLPFPSGVYNKYTNPNAFGYVGGVTQTIAAGTSIPCQFTLSLPAGAHKIVVTAIVLYPGDYDATNNSTATFTVTAALGPPDIAAATLQQQASTGGALSPLGGFTVMATVPINLVQWVSLVSGAPTGPIACTLTLTNTSIANSTPVSYNGSAPSSSASCVVLVTFPAAGTYTITSTVATPATVTDPNLLNNTATNTLVVTSGPPSSTVAVGDISYADPYNAGAINALTATGAPEDTVHAGDLVTYTAGLNVAGLTNTSAVNVTCKVMEGTTDLASRITWVTGPTLNAVTAGQKACVFKLAFDETDNVAHNHTITVSVTTPGSTNNATSASTSLNGTISNVVRVHTVAAPLQRVGDGTAANAAAIVNMDTTKQSTAVTFQTVIANATTHATRVDCALTANTLLLQAAVGTVTGVNVPANGSAKCQFKVTAATVGSYPLSVTVTPSSGAPLDPIPAADHVANGVITVVSTGAFTSINLQSVGLDQRWYSASGGPAFPVYSLNVQRLDINQMALLVVPAQATLGHFTLNTQIVNGAYSYPVASISGDVLRSETSGTRCSDVAAPAGTAYANAPADFPTANITFAADICAAPTTVGTNTGYQAITIDFTQSMTHAIINPDPKFVLGGATAADVYVKVDLFFSLTPGGTSDHVSAIIRLPLNAPRSADINDGNGHDLWTQTSAAPLVVTSIP